MNEDKLKGHQVKKQEARCPSVNSIVQNVTLKILDVIRVILSKTVSHGRFFTAGIARLIFLKPRIHLWKG
jgi:hypothetical protein